MDSLLLVSLIYFPEFAILLRSSSFKLVQISLFSWLKDLVKHWYPCSLAALGSVLVGWFVICHVPFFFISFSIHEWGTDLTYSRFKPLFPNDSYNRYSWGGPLWGIFALNAEHHTFSELLSVSVCDSDRHMTTSEFKCCDLTAAAYIPCGHAPWFVPSSLHLVPNSLE